MGLEIPDLSDHLRAQVTDPGPLKSGGVRLRPGRLGDVRSDRRILAAGEKGGEKGCRQNGLLEKQALGNGKFAGLRQLLPLGYGRCRLSIAVPHDFDYQSIDSLNGKVIATSYKGLLAQYLADRKIDADIVTMEGAVEVAPRTHLADVICDLVSTGSTLVSNGLVEKDIILQSQAVLVTNQLADPEIAALAEKVTSRIKAVLRAENSRYIMLNSPIDSLEAIKAVLPGSQSPTVMPLQGRDDMVAVHAVCEEGVFWDTMEDLKANGANSILVVPIEKMLD